MLRGGSGRGSGVYVIVLVQQVMRVMLVEVCLGGGSGRGSGVYVIVLVQQVMKVILVEIC